MKRNIPIFRVVLSDGADFETVRNHPGVNKTVIDESLYAIKEALSNKRKKTDLFKIYNTNLSLEIDYSQFKSCLNHIINYYIKHEEYDRCAEIRDLIKQL